MTGSRRTEEEWERAVEGLQSVARRAEELGVALCVEPLNRFETYFLNTLQDASQLVHANIEERQPAAAVRSVAKDLGRVHISENDRGIPGTGHVDWRGVLSVLREVGYEG